MKLLKSKIVNFGGGGSVMTEEDDDGEKNMTITNCSL